MWIPIAAAVLLILVLGARLLLKGRLVQESQWYIGLDVNAGYTPVPFTVVAPPEHSGQMIEDWLVDYELSESLMEHGDPGLMTDAEFIAYLDREVSRNHPIQQEEA